MLTAIKPLHALIWAFLANQHLPDVRLEQIIQPGRTSAFLEGRRPPNATNLTVV
jgi:hypothetical protein